MAGMSLRPEPARDQPHEQDARTAQPPEPAGRNARAPAQTASPHASAADISALTPLVLASADASAALASDDLARYRRLLPALHTALASYIDTAPDAKNGPLAQFTSGLKPGPSLAEARAAYEVFSTALADLARAAHLHHSGLVTIYQCPMTPVLGTGRWVQRPESPGLRNPFFGSAMLECGEEIE